MLSKIIGEDMGLIECPHCTQIQAHYEIEEERLVVIKCTCGHLSVVYEEGDDKTIKHVLPKRKTELPRKGTKLSKCLGAIASIHPNQIQTKEVAFISGDDNSGAASKLMVLQHKGLVDKVTSLRGVAGGSTWALTSRAIEYLNLR